MHRRATSATIASICEINAHQNSYVGKTVEIFALWKTDNLNYSYLQDIHVPAPKCRDRDRDVILMGYQDRMHDESVTAFFKFGRELCKANNKRISCSQSASVRVIATIMRDHDGLYVHLDKVLKYKYLEE